MTDKKQKSPSVLKHYEVPEILPDGNFKAKCNYCQKDITGSTKATTNWWKHLRRVHSTILDEEQNEAGSQSTITQPQKKYDSKRPKQSLVTNALVDFVTDDLVPISVVDSTRFKALLGALDPQYQLPTHEHFSTVLLKSKYESLKRSLCDQLRETNTINLTIDIWSNHLNRSYLSVAGHYISDQWSLESVMLGCSQVTGRHTADKLKLWYEGIVSDFNISEKVQHIITDCRTNTTYLTLPDFEDIQDNTTSNEEFEKQDCISLSLEYDKIFEHHTCFEHMLELVVKDGMATADCIGTVIKKCSSMVPFMQRSTIATDVLREETTGQGGKLATSKWSSQLKTIRNTLCNILEILTPFEEAADFVQAGCSPTTGYVLPCIRGLHHHMQSMVSKHQSVLATSLQQSLKKRMLYYEQNETYILAAMLDPRFKLRWCFDNDEKQKSVSILKSALGRMISQLSNTAIIDDNGEPPPKKKKSSFSFMSFMYDGEYSLSQSLPIDSVDDYIEATTVPLSTDPAKFWQDNEEKYHSLSRLAKDVLAVPTSSCPVDRLFSTTGKVFTPETCWLDDVTFKQSTFIKCNNKHTN
ncbi:zinc finger BED domain-containing protein 4-like isoform X2 [Dysidea avara]|uniref:zinc finger BED domain-containing protein 4-like isoform X2 n=1 Tax=Dysidea avara TaxID=196820 RepID=UPI003320FCA6